MMAAKRHKKSLVTAKPEPRAAGISRLYLGMSEFGIYGQEWAGYALIGEADGFGNAGVVDGMREAYAGFSRQEFEEGTEDVEDIKRDVAGRAFHTIGYFEGDLGEDEKKDLEKEPPPPQNMYTPT
ncbi:MAG: hypothetical protein IIC06_08510 [Proteobacteria bacterium]|nr:hypothetical protein [Pseudomonadota bacterium]